MSFEYNMLHKRVDLKRKKLSDNIHDVPQEDLLMVMDDINCHIGSTHDGLEDVM